MAPELKRNLVERACGKSQRECEALLVAELPAARASLAERIRPLDAEVSEVRVVLKAEVLAKLDRLKGLLAAAAGTDGGLAAMIELLADRELARQESKKGRGVAPGRPGGEETSMSDHRQSDSKDHRALKVAGESLVPGRSDGPADSHVHRSDRHAPSRYPAAGRPRIAAATRREVWARARGQCEHPGCGSRFRLEIDHRRPRALGGGDDLDNLRLLCRTHNLFEARRQLGGPLMSRYLPILRPSAPSQ